MLRTNIRPTGCQSQLPSLILYATFLSQCVSDQARTTDTELVNEQVSISCQPSTKWHAEHYRLIECTLTNHTSSDLELGIDSITFDPEGGVRMLSPQDISEYVRQYKDIENNEKKGELTFLSGLLLVAPVAIISKSRSQNSPELMAPTTIAAKEAKDNARVKPQPTSQAPSYSAQHLLAKPLLLPASSSVERQVFVQILKPKALPRALDICLSQPTETCTLAPFGEKRRGKQVWD